MTPRALTMLWGLLQVAYLASFAGAWLKTLDRPLERSGVLLAVIPGMFGSWVFYAFVQVYVLGDQGRSWAVDPDAFRTVWVRWWAWMIALSPVVLATGLWALRFEPRTPWSLAVRVLALLSAVVGVFVLAILSP